MIDTKVEFLKKEGILTTDAEIAALQETAVNEIGEKLKVLMCAFQNTPPFDSLDIVSTMLFFVMGAQSSVTTTSSVIKDTANSDHPIKRLELILDLCSPLIAELFELHSFAKVRDILKGRQTKH
jgi:hypothetical protein